MCSQGKHEDRPIVSCGCSAHPHHFEPFTVRRHDSLGCSQYHNLPGQSSPKTSPIATHSGGFARKWSPSTRAATYPTFDSFQYQYREDLQAVVKRQETAQSAKILASFKIDDLSWNEYEGIPDENHLLPHFQACRHWPMVGNMIKVRLNELLLDLLREKVGLKKCMEVDVDIGCRYVRRDAIGVIGLTNAVAFGPTAEDAVIW